MSSNMLVKGYTLIEAVIAVTILSIMVMMILPGTIHILNLARSDLTNMCLWESAFSELNRIKSNPSVVGQSRTCRCGNIDVRLESFVESGTIPAQPNPSLSNQRNCALVVVRSSTDNKSVAVKGTVCKLP